MITVNGAKFEPTKFPNGEIGFEISDQGIDVKWAYEGDHELVYIKMLADRCVPSTLDIQYLPYSRMDRTKGDWAFTLKSVCEMINECGFYWVEVAEPHSDVSMALLDNAEAYYPTREIFDTVCEEIGFEKGRDYIVFPDAGAEKRYGGMYTGHRYMVGFKRRAWQSGEITHFDLMDPTRSQIVTHPKETKALIIDDLCSKGGTFLATAETLKRDYAIVDTTLLVAHLETSVHRGEMINSGLIQNIYATNSIYHPKDVNALRPHPKIHIYDWRASAVPSNAAV